MIWWTAGFVEYQFPNYLGQNDKLEMLDLSMELGSELIIRKGKKKYTLVKVQA